MERRYIDFDAMMAETQTQAPPTIRLKGRDYTLPQSMPAILMLKAMRLKAEIGTLTNKEFVDELESMFIGLFGDQWNAILEIGYGIEELVAMLQTIMEMYQGNARTPEPTKQTPEPGT